MAWFTSPVLRYLSFSLALCVIGAGHTALAAASAGALITAQNHERFLEPPLSGKLGAHYSCWIQKIGKSSTPVTLSTDEIKENVTRFRRFSISSRLALLGQIREQLLSRLRPRAHKRDAKSLARNANLRKQIRIYGGEISVLKTLGQKCLEFKKPVVTPDPTPTPVIDPPVNGSVVLNDAVPGLTFQFPVDLKSARDGSGRLFVVEQRGKIKVFPRQGTGQVATDFLDLTGRLATGGEQGLLGLAFHPQYATNGQFFVNYTRKSDGASIVSRFHVSSGNANLADINSEQILLTVAQPFANHNGGAVEFGPDGYLYLSFGDGGSGGDPLGNGQNLSTLLGKILRIDINHTQAGLPYAIPSDNPFVGNTAGARQEIFAYGLRNPWRMSFDATLGTLWTGDVGQNAVEEVDIIQRGGNYGWNTMEGDRCYSPSSGCNMTGLVLPVAQYDHNLGQSITGGYVYRGTAVPPLVGKYIYADFASGKVWTSPSQQPIAGPRDLLSTGLLISAFGQDENNELYLLSYLEGKVYRFGFQPVP